MKKIFLAVAFLIFILSSSSCIPLLLIQLKVNNVIAGRVMELKVHLINVGKKGEKVYIERLTDDGSYVILEREATLDDEKNAIFKVIEFNSGDVFYKVSGEDFSRVFKITVKKPSWAVGVYMAADNSLNDLALYDIEEMTKLSGDVALYVLWDKKRLLDEEVYFSSTPVYLDLGEELDSGNEETLKNFLRNLLSIDAENYAVILWNHGSAWLWDSKYEKKKGMSLEAIAIDDDPKDALSMREISSILRDVLNYFGIDKLGILGMDACVMGNLAVAYQMRNVAEYLIASEAVEPAYGWDYEFLSDVDDDTTPSQLSKMIVGRYKEFYKDYTYPFTLSVYDEDKINDLAISLSNLGKALSDAIKEDNSIKEKILNEVVPYIANMYDSQFSEGKNLVDIKDFVYKLEKAVDSLHISSDAYGVLSSLKDVVVYSYSQGFGEDKAISGLSIFLPSSSDTLQGFNSDLQTLDFYTDPLTAGWLDFLKELLF